MAKIHTKEFNPFSTVRNLKNIGIKTLSFENISKTIKVSSSVERDLNIEKVHLLDKKINFTQKYMSSLGYSETEIKKEVEAKLAENDH